MHDTLSFLSIALRTGVTCSFEHLEQAGIFSGTSKLEVYGKIASFLDEHGLEANPPADSPDCEWHDKRSFTRKENDADFQIAFKEAITREECHTVEFKQTLILDVNRKLNHAGATREQLCPSYIPHEVIKTITAFLNADGGTLLIGVADDLTIHGVEGDYPYLNGDPTRDTWELYLRNIFQERIPEYRTLKGYINCSHVQVENLTVYVIIVKPRKERISVCYPMENKSTELVYVRDGNRTLKLKAKEIESHILDRHGLLR